MIFTNLGCKLLACVFVAFAIIRNMYKLHIYVIGFDCDSWYINCMACFFKHIFTNKPLEILFHQQNCRCQRLFCEHRGPGHLDRLRVGTDLQKLGAKEIPVGTPMEFNMVHLKIPP